MRRTLVALLGLVLVCTGSSCQPRLKPRVGEDRHHSPLLLEVKERLLRLHPDWQVRSYSHVSNPSLSNGYYFVSRPDAKQPPETDAYFVLDKESAPVTSRIVLPELDEKEWRGIVYARFFFHPPVLYTDKPEEDKPGWYVRVLIRAGCLFFGDKEMLKQIDKDLATEAAQPSAEGQ